jgi:hypothetical protein
MNKAAKDIAVGDVILDSSGIKVRVTLNPAPDRWGHFSHVWWTVEGVILGNEHQKMRFTGGPDHLYKMFD